MRQTLNLSRSSVLSALVSLALLLSIGGPARAATETVDVAARIARMNTVATNVTTAIAERQTRAINRMTELDAAGKADRVILAAAKTGKRAVEEVAERGRREIRTIAARTIQQLNKQNADPALKVQVETARDAALTTINNAVLTAKQAINAKADELTGASG